MPTPSLPDQLESLHVILAALSARGIHPIEVVAHGSLGPCVQLTPADFRLIHAGCDVEVRHFRGSDLYRTEAHGARWTATDFVAVTAERDTETIRLPGGDLAAK